MTKLMDIDPGLVPLHVGETVAFREDHETWPGMYGTITEVGIDEDGQLGFDLRVFNPFTGPTATLGDHRATIGDIQ